MIVTVIKLIILKFIINFYVENKKLWININETNDIEGQYVTNVIIGILEIGRLSKMFLFNTKVLEKENSSTIVELFDKTMSLLWPYVKHDNVVLFLSYIYIVKAGKNIKYFYLKTKNVTCLGYSLHKIIEEIRKSFSKKNKCFNIKLKNIFIKCSSRVLKCKEMVPGILMTPQPISTRWGT